MDMHEALEILSESDAPGSLVEEILDFLETADYSEIKSLLRNQKAPAGVKTFLAGMELQKRKTASESEKKKLQVAAPGRRRKPNNSIQRGGADTRPP